MSDSEALRKRAKHCREQARDNPVAATALIELARAYEAEADRIDNRKDADRS